MECRTVIAVYVFKDGMTRRIYKTKREPPRYYYQVEGNRVYIEESFLTEQQKQIITIKGGN